MSSETAEAVIPRAVPSSNPNLWSRLTAWRSTPGFGPLEYAIQALFCVFAGYALHYHEPWDDEAQAWLIARDNSVWQILVHSLHYEGAPPLWHLLLHIFHLLGGTYEGIGWLSLAFAAAGIYVFLRWSPFPLLIRVLLPFTYFLLYQHAIIARGYVLIPLLIFSLSALYWRSGKTLLFAVIAGLLANISVQGFLLSLCLGTLYWFDLSRRERGSSRPRRSSAMHRQKVLAGALFAGMACVAIYCAIPAPDLNFAIGDQVSTGPVHRILLKLVGETLRNAPHPSPDPPAPPWPTLPKPDWHTAPRHWLAWEINHRDVSGLGRHPVLSDATLRIVDIISQSTWPIANSNLLACVFLGLLALWLCRRGALRMLLPWTSLILLGVALWTAEHHAGILLLALLSGIWIAAASPANRRPSPRLDRSFVAVFALVLMLQIGWSVYCVWSDVHGSYDPGPETAAWLQANAKGDRVAAFHFQTVSVQPWFPRSRFFNVPASWWQWSSNVEVDGIHRTILNSHPDIVVFGMESPGYGQIRDQWLPLNVILPEEEKTLAHDAIVADLHKHGYFETHRFCGTRFARFSSSYRNCNLIFQPLKDK